MYEVTEFKGCKRGLIELPACFVYKHLSTHFHYGEHFATIPNVTVLCLYLILNNHIPFNYVLKTFQIAEVTLTLRVS